MAEHYTRNTTGVMKYCNTCGKRTMHKVSGKRLGLCENDHHKAKIPQVVKQPDSQESLF